MFEAIFNLLNTILQRVVFKYMTIFLFFFFVSLYFMPSELAADMNVKTPPFFPDWLPLSTLASIVFTCLATMMWKPFEKLLKWLRKAAKKRKEIMEWEAVYKKLSAEEIVVIRKVFVAGMTPVRLPPDRTTELLLAKNIVYVKLFSELSRSYILNPSFNLFFKSKVTRGFPPDKL